jgi:acetyltransferase (GNAT) family protein
VKQVGFVRVISDKSRFAWVADFFILPPYRGNGLGKALLSSVMNCSEFRVPSQAINTMGSDALTHLLEKYGNNFRPITDEHIDAMYRFARAPISEPVSTTSSSVLATDLIPHPTLQGYFASTSTGLLDISVIHTYLRTSYWAPGIAIEAVEQAIANSDCIGIYWRNLGEEGPSFYTILTQTHLLNPRIKASRLR